MMSKDAQTLFALVGWIVLVVTTLLLFLQNCETLYH